MTQEQYIVERIRDLIYRSLPPVVPVSVLGPVCALDELAAWVGDDHQWNETRPKNWDTLLRDLQTSWKAIPHALKTFAASSDGAALTILGAARQRLKTEKGNALDPALRAALATAERDLRAIIVAPAALRAAWADLIRAVKKTDFVREQQALALLASVAELQEKPWRPLSRRIWGVLSDDQDEINALRAEVAGRAPPAAVLPPTRAHESATVRLDLAKQALALPATSGDLIVWLAFVRAHVPDGRVEVGSAVTLFDGRWMFDVLMRWDDSADARSDIPAEVAANRNACVEAWETERADMAFALVRIAVGRGPIAAALDEARATAGALVRLAAFYDRGRSCWRDSGAYIIFVDGQPDWSRRGIGADRDDRGATLDLARDQTAVTLAELAPTIGPHLPVTDPEVRRTMDLLRWLTEARRTWSPPALLLNDRVLENVAGWASYTDSSQFAIEQLALAWAFSQATTEIADAGIQAVHGIDRTGGLTPSDPTRRAAFLEAVGPRNIVEQGGIAGDLAHLTNVITEISWLCQLQQPASDGRVRLASLGKLTASGPDAARWIGTLTADFGVLLDRAKRTRNAIAHGGPIAESTLLTVGRFYDEIAADALNHALYARLTGQSARALFDSRRQRLAQAVEDLAQSKLTPAQGLVV